MSFSLIDLRKSLLADVEAAIAPPIKELRSASSVLPVLLDAEHKRRAVVQERLAQIECEIEQTLSRRNANARHLDFFAHPPKPAEPVDSTVMLPFTGKRVRP